MFVLNRSSLSRLLVWACAVTLPSCGADSSTSDGDEVRTIEVVALDDFRFDPSEVAVSAGETVRFVVTNEGALPHEFLLGSREEQEQAEEAGEHGGGHEGSEFDVLRLDPGETAETTVTFEDHDQLLYGCHVPGHYEAGMVGTVVVE